MAYFMNVVSYHTAESTIVVVFVLKKTRIKRYLVILGYLWKYKRFDGDLRSSNLINIEGNITKNNKNKYSQLSPCLDAPKFVMLSFFTLIFVRTFGKNTAQECQKSTSGWCPLLKPLLKLPT